MKRAIVSICLASAFILWSQPAMAETRIYVNLGLPVVHLQMGDWGPCGEYLWIEGYYRVCAPGYAWVPGYWIPAVHNHAVCVKRPRVYHHYHGAPAGHGYVRPPQHQGGRPDHSIRGGSGRNDSWHDGRSHGIRRQSTSSGNWMNNIRGNVLNRQNRSAR